MRNNPSSESIKTTGYKVGMDMSHAHLKEDGSDFKIWVKEDYDEKKDRLYITVISLIKFAGLWRQYKNGKNIW